MAGFEWTHPGALLLALPAIALLALAFRRGRPAELETGTLDLWLALSGGRASSDARRRPMPPVWLALLVLASVLLAAAAAGPRRMSPAATSRLRVVVAPGPDLALPFVGPDGATDTRARLEFALERAVRWIDEQAPAARIDWFVGERFLGAGGRRAPAELTPRSLLDVPPIEPSDFDRRGTLLVLAREPATPLSAASWVASGGGAVPGAIAPTLGSQGRPVGRRFEGGQVHLTPHGGDAVLVSSGLPTSIETLVGAWAESRGLRMVSEPGSAPIWLEVGAFADRLPEGARLDGASWQVPLGPPRTPAVSPAPEDSRVELSVDGTAAVVSTPGAVWFAAREWGSVIGSETAFALHMARILDRAARAPAGRAPVSARRAAGR
ncbi:MAG: hypothetical protein AAFZ65_17710, partial [Planctomycetota bacterium]